MLKSTQAVIHIVSHKHYSHISLWHRECVWTCM